MKPATLLLSLCLLLLLSCKKDPPKPDTPASQKFYPTELTRTASANPDISTTRYTYNNANQVIREAFLVNGNLQHYFTYTYTPGGDLQKKVRHDAADLALEQDEFELDATGQPTRLNHSYLDQSGTPTLHHYNTFRYNSQGKLEERSEFDPVGQLLKKLTFEQTAPDLEKVQAFRNNNSLELSTEASYDLKKHPLAATGLNQNNLPGNIIFYTLVEPSNQDTTTISSAITYNEAGFPLKIVQTYSDGRILTDTYTYVQR